MKTIKRLIAAALLLCVLVLPAQAKTSGTFSDVPETHWAYNSIRFAAKYHLMQGIGGGEFGLHQEMSRAAFATTVCRLMSWQTVSPAVGSFTDNQDTGAWYYAAIETAYANGALTKQSGECRPLEAISREEAAVMLLRALGYTTLAGMVQEDCPFSDVSTNQGYIALAYRMGIITGTDFVTFAPKRALTREEAATILLRVYDKRNTAVAQSTDAAPAEAARAESSVGMTGAVPLSPRAPMEGVYAAAIKAGAGGAVVLCARPLRQTVEGEAVSEGEEISQEELTALLADEKTEKLRSARFESSYLLRREDEETTTVVWYESSHDLTVKINLCRLMGIKTVYIER